jgi:hypothetical protein
MLDEGQLAPSKGCQPGGHGNRCSNEANQPASSSPLAECRPTEKSYSTNVPSGVSTRAISARADGRSV